MESMFTRIIFALIFLTVSFGSGGAWRHGLNTTWNGNVFGGGWVCFQTAITGCSQGFNATCNGVADDKTAWNNFLTYAASVPSAKLYVPPGAACKNSDGFLTTIPGATIQDNGTPVPDLTIWGYGASFDTLFIGTQSPLFTNNTHNALLQNANVGDATITLVTAGDASKFSIGKWVIVCGLALQTFGSPPNWGVFEYRKITNIVGGVLTLSLPLSYSYKSTWPQGALADVSTVNFGGPASVYQLNNAWDQDLKIYGLRVKQAGALFSAARAIELWNIAFDSLDSVAPSISNNYAIYNSGIGSPEFDKLLDTLTVSNVTGKQFIFQSASTNHANITNVVLSDKINGTTNNLTISNLTVPQIKIGPTGFGHGTSFTISNSRVATAAISNICLPPSAVTYSAGTFTMPKSASAGDKAFLFQWTVPGQKYYFADNDGTNNSVPHTQFTIINYREDVTNYYVDTDIVGALPTPTCNGSPCDCYTSYQTSVVTQTNTGPADFTPYAP